MDNALLVTQYAAALNEQLLTGQAREHGYRPALVSLMDGFEDVVATNDPKRSEFGNPDMIFQKRSNHGIILGYAETKDVNVDLDRAIKTEQLHRYAGYNKLFLTNYLEFRFFRNGEEYERVSIGELNGTSITFRPNEFKRLSNELYAFLQLPPEPIKNGRSLALIMGQRGRRIRDNVRRYLEEKDERNIELVRIYDLMKDMLVHDLTRTKFADMYAQTLVYGLFAARYNDTTPDNFTRQEASELVPPSNPFLREFFGHIGGIHFDKRLAHIVDELCEVFSVSDVQELVHKHLRILHDDNDKDPIIHFYEDFLKEYDPAERKRMGAYYTPLPVVRFIIRQVDKILKVNFGLADGLADTSKVISEIETGQDLRHDRRRKLVTTQRREYHKVQILDPAVGTATFLNEIIKYLSLAFKGQEGRWPSYVENELLPRLSGFELMMAPYTIAHLKLAMTLKETGAKTTKGRLGVYLTNTLEEGIPAQRDLFSFGLAAAVTEESVAASEIKHDRPVMLVIGNPPYSISSNNKSEFIEKLLKDYKQNLSERNIQPLSDDYIKFIRFAEAMIAKNGEGVMAMITNNSYLDGVIHNQMRKHLLNTFDDIYILDLHGNSKKKEVTPEGDKDMNVFDIQQGVAIILAVKSGLKPPEELGTLHHAELFGLRAKKFSALNDEPEWKIVPTKGPNYAFIPQDLSRETEYSQFIDVSDLFITKGSGIKFRKDNLLIKPLWSRSLAEQMVSDVQRLDDAGLSTKYNLKETADWQIKDQRVNFADPMPQDFIKVQYKPFDYRWTFYPQDLINRIIPRGDSRRNLMKNMIGHDNYGIVIMRSQVSTPDFRAVMCTVDPVDINFFGFQSNLFPLYNYHNDGTRTENFDKRTLSRLTENLTTPVFPEDVMDYIYAVLHSPSYREKYKTFLKKEFPKIPIPDSDEAFQRYVGLGKRLRELHLLRSQSSSPLPITFPVQGSDKIERVEFKDDMVWINETQYFGNIPHDIRDFLLGGYPPAQKWLKDRRGKQLTSEEILHYQKILQATGETLIIMKEIG